MAGCTGWCLFQNRQADALDQSTALAMADNQLGNKIPHNHLLEDVEVNATRNTKDGESQHVTVEMSPPPSRSGGAEWRAWKLKWWWMISLVIIEAGMIATIIYLQRRSASQNGVTSVPEVSSSSVSSHFSISNIWKYGLLWTTLPSLVMTIYRMMWETIVSGTSERQPFVELRRPQPKAASAKVTIMLDYRSYPLFFSWIVALGNGHLLLGVSMLLSLILSIAVVPLTAHLFVAAQSQSSSSVALSFSTTFNESALTVQTSLQPAIDLSNAIRVYGGNPPPWMALEYGFQAFVAGTENMPRGNITADTNAYSAQLDCQAFSPEDSSASYSDGVDGTRVNYQFNDRGCEVSGYIFVVNTTSTYASSWQSNCEESVYGRIGIFAGIYSNTSSIKIANYTLISCNVSYWNTSGSMTVSLQPGAPPQFVSFTPKESTAFHPLFYRIFEYGLHYYTFFDGSGSIESDAFGFSVYSLAKTRDPTSPITPDLIQNSTRDIFQTLYAGLAVTVLLQNTTTPRTANGELSTAVTRLYVVTPVAYTIAAILALILVCNVSLFIYAQVKHSILLEQPTGLLGNAVLLDQSQLQRFVSDFRREHPGESKLVDYVKKNYAVNSSKCYLERVSGRILVEDLVEKI
jgi:hypothetical protein